MASRELILLQLLYFGQAVCQCKNLLVSLMDNKYGNMAC